MIAAVALIVLSSTTAYSGVVLAICAVGLSYGGFLALMGPVTADAFGPRHLGVNFGIMFLTVAFFAYAGPQLAALVAEANDGDYSKAFVMPRSSASRVSSSSVATCCCGDAGRSCRAQTGWKTRADRADRPRPRSRRS